MLLVNVEPQIFSVGVMGYTNKGLCAFCKG